MYHIYMKITDQSCVIIVHYDVRFFGAVKMTVIVKRC